MTDSRNVIVIKRSFDQFSVKKTNMHLLKMYFISPDSYFYFIFNRKTSPQIIKMIHQNEIDESQRIAKSPF
jgi:hypothetical protein